jgi:hypothetical protein
LQQAQIFPVVESVPQKQSVKNMSKPALDIVDGFATALDKDDFELAITMLDQACVYETSEKRFDGPESVIASFRGATEWAHQHLDAISYLHTVDTCSDCHGVIKFVDNVEHGGKQMQQTCFMHVRLGKANKVLHLRLEDVAGEKEKVSDFLRAVGVSR